MAFDNSATNSLNRGAEPARATHALFICLLVFVILPSRYFTGLRPPASPTSPTLNLISVFVVWLLLWRLCAARPFPTFLALAIGGVFLSAFRHPLVGPAIYLVLLLAHLRLRATDQLAPAEEQRVDGELDAGWDYGSETLVTTDTQQIDATGVELVDLDPIVAPYIRLLLAVRTARAAVASMLFITLTMIPDALVSPVLAGYGALSGVVFAVIAGIPMALFAVLVSLLFFKVLRTLWSGSIAALRSCFFLSIVVIPWGGLGLYLDTSRQDLLNGRVWFRAVDYALHTAVFFALAFGTAFILRWRQHEDFLALLRENRRRDWRTALMQLCGVLWPRKPWWAALRERSVRWSLVAFFLEGVGFFPIGSANTSSAQPLALLVPPRVSLRPLEGHYISVAVIVCLFVPALFLWMQVLFRFADIARVRARRAALQPAAEARRADERPPVLFLRSFQNDQVSLRSISVRPAVRLVDPAFEQAHLEDVLQTCLSLGPVIAIGRPSDQLAPLGVPRLYVPAAEWQKVVLDLMHAASMIVLGMSESAGVIWEVEQLTVRCYLEKTVFVVPPEQARNQRLLRDVLGRILSKADFVRLERELATIAATRRERRVVAVTCRHDRAKIFLTARRLSQVQYELALRLGGGI